MTKKRQPRQQSLAGYSVCDDNGDTKSYSSLQCAFSLQSFDILGDES